MVNADCLNCEYRRETLDANASECRHPAIVTERVLSLMGAVNKASVTTEPFDFAIQGAQAWPLRFNPETVLRCAGMASKAEI